MRMPTESFPLVLQTSLVHNKCKQANTEAFRGFQKARVVWKRVLKVGTHNVEKCTFASYRVQQEQKERLSDVFNASNTLKVVYNLKRSGRKRDKDTKTAWKHEGDRVETLTPQHWQIIQTLFGWRPLLCVCAPAVCKGNLSSSCLDAQNILKLSVFLNQLWFAVSNRWWWRLKGDFNGSRLICNNRPTSINYNHIFYRWS